MVAHSSTIRPQTANSLSNCYWYFVGESGWKIDSIIQDCPKTAAFYATWSGMYKETTLLKSISFAWIQLDYSFFIKFYDHFLQSAHIITASKHLTVSECICMCLWCESRRFIYNLLTMFVMDTLFLTTGVFVSSSSDGRLSKLRRVIWFLVWREWLHPLISGIPSGI